MWSTEFHGTRACLGKEWIGHRVVHTARTHWGSPRSAAVGGRAKPNKWPHLAKLQHASAALAACVTDSEPIRAHPPRAIDHSIGTGVASLHRKAVLEDGTAGGAHRQVSPTGSRHNGAARVKAVQAAVALVWRTGARTANANTIHRPVVKSRVKPAVSVLSWVPRVCPVSRDGRGVLEQRDASEKGRLWERCVWRL